MPPVQSASHVHWPVAVSQTPCAEHAPGHVLGSVDSAQDAPVACGATVHGTYGTWYVWDVDMVRKVPYGTPEAGARTVR